MHHLKKNPQSQKCLILPLMSRNLRNCQITVYNQTIVLLEVSVSVALWLHFMSEAKMSLFNPTHSFTSLRLWSTWHYHKIKSTVQWNCVMFSIHFELQRKLYTGKLQRLGGEPSGCQFFTGLEHFLFFFFKSLSLTYK